MKAQELREKSVDELKQEMMSLMQQQFKMRMKNDMGEAAQPHVFKIVRRSIARIKTILNEKERQL